MRNILLLSFDGTSHIEYDEKPEFDTIVNTWKKDVTEYPHPCIGVYYSPTQRHGEAMYIQSKILRDLDLYYDYVASFCHDLKIKVSEINRYFRLAHHHELDVFGPSMTRNSFISHQQFAHQGTNDIIPRDWIEIMAIGFSRRCYEKLIYHLDILYGELNLVGGWGLDNKMIKHIISKNKFKCAMIDEIQINHFVRVTRGEIKWRNGMSSRQCMAFFDVYLLRFMSKKSSFNYFVKKQSNNTLGYKPFYERADNPSINKFNNLLYVRLTCLKEKHMWNSFRRENVNQILLCGNPDLKTNYELAKDVLYLKCHDTYEHLPTKMIMAFNTILKDDRFKNITHILKLDNDINIDVAWNFVNKRSDFIKDTDYSGGKILSKPGAEWHFDRVPLDSHWSNKRFFEKNIHFASGGHTYTLSRNALRIICNEFNFNNIDEVHQKYILEDVMVGLILERNNIYPKDLGLKVVNTSAVEKRMPRSKRTGIQSLKSHTPRPRVKKNLVVQIFFDHKLITNKAKTHTNHNRGPLITSRMTDHKIFEDSQRIARSYAKRCGAEYTLFTAPVIDFFSPSMERMRLIEEEKWAKDYDNILYIDCDTIISDKCPNLFEEYPQKTLRVCPTLMSQKWLIEKESTMIQKFGQEKVCNQYFNGGVILFHSSTLDLMRGKLKYRERFNTYAFDDQSELNWIALEHDIPMTMMSRTYNSKPGTNVMISHYLGTLKHKYGKNNKRKRIKKRTSVEKPKPNPKVQKHPSGLLVVRCSELNQKNLWNEGIESCHNELIVCRNESLDRPYQIIDDVLYIKSNKDLFHCSMLKIVSSLTTLRKNTHFAIIDVNQNRSKYFDGIDYEKLRKIHAVGDTLRFGSTSTEPYIVSRRSINFCKQSGLDKDEWKAKLANSGIEIFNFDYLRL